MTKIDDITIGIKTFNRESKIRQSLLKASKFSVNKIIVCDDGDISASQQEFYDEMRKDRSFQLIRPEYDVGLSEGRNLILESTETPFLLMIDDDQLIPENISDLKEILVNDERLGGVSGFWHEHGRIICQAYDTYVSDRVLVKTIPRRKKEKFNSLSYYVADHIPNSTLFRTSCLIASPWDPFYKIGYEHEDFYLSHKLLDKWLFAVTPDVIINHVPEGERHYDQNFRQKKERIDRSREHFLRKWNLDDVIGGLPLKGWTAASLLIQLIISTGFSGKNSLLIKNKIAKFAPKNIGRGTLRRPR
jgi:glycosyltransferase involved in cell wall biosynthesis